MSRKVEIGDLVVEARPLTRKDIREGGLKAYGYMTIAYEPIIKEDGETLDLAKVDEGVDKVLDIVFGEELADKISATGGVNGIHAAHTAVMAETYGSKGEEKNSSQPGSESQTKTE